jgi:putative ABC transport system permease protein
MLRDLAFRLRALVARRALDEALQSELQAHLAAQTDKHERAGLPRDEAARLARLEFGGLAQTTDACRDARGVALVATAAHDLRYAARGLRRQPAFTLIAVATLALGIGASTTVFSVVRTVLLKPLPYPEPGMIVFPWRVPPRSVNVGFAEVPWDRVSFQRFERESRTFARLGAFLGASFNLTGRGEPVRLDGARVSAGFFPALGVAPALGRVFSAEEDREDREHEVVLSDRLWRDRFDADPRIVGRTIDVNGAPYAVVGVMPPGFEFPRAPGMPPIFALPARTALWVPLALARAGRIRGEPSELAVIGRLAPGQTVQRAQAELDLFARRNDRELPAAKGWFDSRIRTMNDQLLGEMRRPLLLLFAAVAVVLLIACANVANLLLSRSIGRTREFAVRAALGAGRGRLVRQLMTESLLVATLGGAAGVGLAAAWVPLVARIGPADVPRLADARVDPIVLAFAVAIAIVSGVLFGSAPALTAARDTLAPALKDAGHRGTTGARSRRLRSLLLAAEVALALVLLIASGLLVRTFAHLVAADGVFEPERVLTFELTLAPASYTDLDRVVRLYHTAIDRLGAVAGVEAAAIGETVPMGGAGESTGLRIPDRPATGDPSPPFANYTIVSPAFFHAVGAPILAGRSFRDTDTGASPPVAIVSAAMARKYWPGQDVIDKQVGVPIERFDMTIVGVAADVKHISAREDAAPEIYVPYTQKPWPSMLTMHVAVRTRRDPASMVPEIRAAIHSVDPDLPLTGVATLAGLADGALAQPRFSMLMVGGFGALALALACVGLYGAVSYAVSSRTQEIGIRLALGAERRRVIRLVVGQGLRIVVSGIGAGLALSIVALRAMRSFLYGVEATDPATFAALSVLLVSVAALACYVPARRAARVDPIVAMRVD